MNKWVWEMAHEADGNRHTVPNMIVTREAESLPNTTD